MIAHLRLKAYGKINLALDVLGRKPDGYHEVRMVMQTVGLHDRIDLYRTREPGICFICRTTSRIWHIGRQLCCLKSLESRRVCPSV